MGIFFETLQNVAALKKFDELQEKGSSPSLAIYRGREIVVIENETGMIGLVKYLWNQFLFCIGILSSDQDTLKKLKEEASLCCSSLAEHHLQGRVKELKDEISDNKKTISGLKSSIFDAQQRVGGLEKKASELEESTRSTKEEFERHTCHLKVCQEAKEQIHTLETRKAALQAELDEVLEKHKKVPEMKEEIARLSQQISKLEDEYKTLLRNVEQANYKAHYEQLVQEHNHLVADSSADKLKIENLARQAHSAERAYREHIDQLNACLQEVIRSNQQETQRLTRENESIRAQNESLRAHIESLRRETEGRRVIVGSHQTEAPYVAPTPIGTQRINPGSSSTEAPAQPSGTDRIPVKKKGIH